MRFWREALLFVVSYIFCSYAVARYPYVFRYIDANSGISDNVIKRIGRRSYGRISIRTQTMLNLYNGATFDYFRQKSTYSYEWHYIGYEREYIDAQYRIWLKKKQLLQLFDLETNRFVENVEKVITSYGVASYSPLFLFFFIEPLGHSKQHFRIVQFLYLYGCRQGCNLWIGSPDAKKTVA